MSDKLYNTELMQRIVALVESQTNFEVRVKNNHYQIFTTNTYQKNFCCESFYGISGTKFDTDFRKTPYHLPKPFALDSKLPPICCKCYAKFTNEDWQAVSPMDDDWMCVKCKAGSGTIEYVPPSGVTIHPLVLIEKKKDE